MHMMPRMNKRDIAKRTQIFTTLYESVIMDATSRIGNLPISTMVKFLAVAGKTSLPFNDKTSRRVACQFVQDGVSWLEMWVQMIVTDAQGRDDSADVLGSKPIRIEECPDRAHVSTCYVADANLTI